MRPVVVGSVVDLAPLVGAAVIAIATVGAVVEDLEHRPVLRQQLAQLIAVVDEVLGRAVILVIAIPRREIDAEPYALPGAGRGDLFHDITLERTVLDRVLRVARGPGAKAIVMLAVEAQPLHPNRCAGVR